MMDRYRTQRIQRRIAVRRWLSPFVVTGLMASTVAVVGFHQVAGADATRGTSSIASAIGPAADTLWHDALEAVINPDDFVCEPGVIDQWIGELLDQTSLDSLIPLFESGALDWPIVYKLFFDNDDRDEFIGVDGAYTREHVKRQRDLFRFWDVPLDDVGLYGMHGAVMQDDAKMIPVVQFILGVDANLAQQIVDDVQEVIETDPTLGYDWPLFSFNAVSFGPDPLKIVMGDGLIAFFEDIGLATNGVDLVYAHEVAHQVQGALDLFGPSSPEATRRTELMADAFATYYLVHARGAAYNEKRALDAFDASFIAGDCAFESPGHHGTPNQREAAAEWGAEQAMKRPRGRINSATTMVALFDAELPTITTPDAP